MKKSDIIYSLIIGEITAIYFVSAFNEIVPDKFLKLYNFSLPILFPILSLLGIYVCYLIGKKILVIYELGKYFLAGVFATIIDLGILNLLMTLTDLTFGWYYRIFKGISFLFSTFIKFFITKFWAFEKAETGKTLKETIYFFGVTFIGLLINVFAASFVNDTIGTQWGISNQLWGNIAGIFGALASFAWNFIGSKFIVFKK